VDYFWVLGTKVLPRCNSQLPGNAGSELLTNANTCQIDHISNISGNTFNVHVELGKGFDAVNLTKPTKGHGKDMNDDLSGNNSSV
jgi:hypothetical protein